MAEIFNFFEEGVKRKGEDWARRIYRWALSFLRGNNYDPNERNLAIARTQRIRTAVQAARGK